MGLGLHRRHAERRHEPSRQRVPEVRRSPLHDDHAGRRKPRGVRPHQHALELLAPRATRGAWSGDAERRQLRGLPRLDRTRRHPHQRARRGDPQDPERRQPRRLRTRWRAVELARRADHARRRPHEHRSLPPRSSRGPRARSGRPTRAAASRRSSPTGRPDRSASGRATARSSRTTPGTSPGSTSRAATPASSTTPTSRASRAARRRPAHSSSGRTSRPPTGTSRSPTVAAACTRRAAWTETTCRSRRSPASTFGASAGWVLP